MQHQSDQGNDAADEETDIVDSMMRVSIAPSSIMQRQLSSSSSDIKSTRTAEGAIMKKPANSKHTNIGNSMSGMEKSMRLDDMNISLHNFHNSNDSSLSLSTRDTPVGEDSISTASTMTRSRYFDESLGSLASAKTMPLQQEIANRKSFDGDESYVERMSASAECAVDESPSMRTSKGRRAVIRRIIPDRRRSPQPIRRVPNRSISDRGSSFRHSQVVVGNSRPLLPRASSVRSCFKQTINMPSPKSLSPSTPNRNAFKQSLSKQSPPSPKASSNLPSTTSYVNVRDYKVLDPLGGEGRYTGALSQTSGQPCGKGRIDFADGVSYYDGEWIHGIWSGLGRLANQQGDVYGGYFMDNLRHGEGTMTYKDGRYFDGFFELDELVDGTMYYHDGSSYEGQFRSGRRDGRGAYRFKDGSTYLGNWKSDRYHGFGELRWSNGARYLGEWRDGVKHGLGREFDRSGQICHQGIWRNGIPDFVHE